VVLSLGIFWVLYLVLGIVWGFLMNRFAKRPLEPGRDLDAADPDSSAPTPVFTY
jgi:hypothetical protein